MTDTGEPCSVRQHERQRSALHDQRGQSLVILTFAMVALLVLMGLALDLGIVYGRRVQLARAADAAAMAAVIEPTSATSATLTLRAYEFMAANGFSQAAVTATRIVSPALSSARLVQVDASLTVDTMFMQLVGIRNVGVQESSLAEFVSPVETLVSAPTPVSTTNVYGIVQDWNLLVIGPEGTAEDGDAYLPLELVAGVSNPYYDDLQGAYPFRIYVPDDYPTDDLVIEILDPGSSNKAAYADYDYDSATGRLECMDQYNGQSATETEYTLLYFDSDGYRHVIDSSTWGLDTPGTDLRWVTAFSVKLSDYPDIATTDSGSKSFFLQVGTTSGGRANGFHLWAGPPNIMPDEVNGRNAALLADPGLEDTGGVSIYSQGYMPINVYPARSPISMTLAYIPPEAAGHTLRVYNFDLECPSSPASQVEFYLEGVPSFTPQSGDISCDGASGTWAATALQIPGFNEFFGAYLRVRYTDETSWSGNASTWRLEYDDLVTQLATVRLVQ